MFKMKSVLPPTHNITTVCSKYSINQSAIDSGQHCQQQGNVMLTLHIRHAENKHRLSYTAPTVFIKWETVTFHQTNFKDEYLISNMITTQDIVQSGWELV